MAFASTLLGALAALAFGAAVLLVASAMLDAAGGARRASATRTRVASVNVSAGEESPSRARPQRLEESSLVARLLDRSAAGRRVADLIVAAAVSQRPAQAVSRVLLGCAGLLAAGWLFTQNPIPGLILAGGALVAAYFWLVGAAEKRLETMRAQLPDAFTLVGNSLGSGLSLVQALSYAAEETEAPLGPELWGLVHDVSAGMSLTAALERFRATVPLRELQTISTAMEIQHRVGGNMREMLEQATASVRQSLELRMSLRAQTAQGRLSSKVVGFMPLALIAIISLMQPNYLAEFFSSAAGIAMFTAAIIADIVGFVLIRKILEIEV